MSRSSYIHPTQEAGKTFYLRGIPGVFSMLNLLRFREVADYSTTPELAPETPISGREAYRLYIAHATPLIRKAGSEVIYSGQGGHFLIGPQEEDWEWVLLVRHQSVAKFMDFASDEAYLKIAGHRTAALSDSRLLPLEEKKFT